MSVDFSNPFSKSDDKYKTFDDTAYLGNPTGFTPDRRVELELDQYHSHSTEHVSPTNNSETVEGS